MQIRTEDFFLRQIEMIGEMISHALRLKVESRFTEGLHLLHSGLHQLFGSQTEVLEMVDAATAAQLIGDPIKIRAYADILKTRAALLSGHRRTGGLQQRVDQLYEEALKLSN